MMFVLRSILCSALLLFLSDIPVVALSRAQVPDSTRKVIAGHRAALQVADSTGDGRVAVDLRLRLATMVKPKEALLYLQDAAAIGDSLGLLEEEVIARTRLAEQYERTGNHRSAYVEALRIVALGNEQHSTQAEEARSRADKDLASAAAERDSLQRIWKEEMSNAKAVGSEVEERSQRWMLIAVVIGLVFLITLFVLLYRSGRSNKRFRAELDGLRAEITTLKEQRPANQVRVTPPPTVPQPVPVLVPPPAPVPAPTPIAAIDPLVIAMFRKMAPERLATLRDARARGDHAKVTRVVHSLKPQLVNFHNDHFTELCARITAPEAYANEARWAADLDAFESGITAVLKKFDH